MPTQRRPKGSLTRTTPDFYTDRAATVGGAFAAAVGNGAALDLFNNATDGSALHVWGLWVGNDAGEGYGITPLKSHGANFLRNASPVIVDGPTPWGQLYYDTIGPLFSGTTFPPGTVFSAALWGNNVSGSQDSFMPPGPICVLQPGYSLRVYAAVGSGITQTFPFAASFYFVALPATN